MTLNMDDVDQLVESEEDLRAIYVAFMLSIPTGKDNSAMVQSPIFPICPKKKTFEASLYTSAERSVCNFTGQSLVEVFRYRLSFPSRKNLEQGPFRAPLQSADLCKIFKSSCNHAPSCRKQMEKDIF